MPARTEDYEVLLDFVNDTHDCATVQLLRDYGRNTGAIVLLRPGESVTLVLAAGSSPRIFPSKYSNQRVIRFNIPIRAQNALQGRERYVRRHSSPSTHALTFSQCSFVERRKLHRLTAVPWRNAIIITIKSLATCERHNCGSIMAGHALLHVE